MPSPPPNSFGQYRRPSSSSNLGGCLIVGAVLGLLAVVISTVYALPFIIGGAVLHWIGVI